MSLRRPRASLRRAVRARAFPVTSGNSTTRGSRALRWATYCRAADASLSGKRHSIASMSRRSSVGSQGFAMNRPVLPAVLICAPAGHHRPLSGHSKSALLFCYPSRACLNAAIAPEPDDDVHPRLVPKYLIFGLCRPAKVMCCTAQSALNKIWDVQPKNASGVASLIKGRHLCLGRLSLLLKPRFEALCLD